MADRFPLILNTSANQIQEIASGDSLDLSGNNIANAGIITAGNVTIGAATTDLIVNGDARITGILTIGTSSLKLDGPNNLVNVGTALTLGHTQGLQFHTQNLHSAGFEVNQINVSGASTMGGDVTFTGDNYNVLWDKSQDQLEFADNAKASFGTGGDLFVFHNGSNSYVQDAGQGILFLDCSETNITKFGSNHNMAKFIGGGAVELYHNNTKRFETTTSGVTVTGDGTFTGNVSIGGTLTYEDVTNIDSVGIVTARDHINIVTDNKKLRIGASQDLELYHDGTHSHLVSNTGNLRILADGSGQLVLTSKAGEESIVCSQDGAVEIMHDNSKKFFTTSNGVQATNRIIVGEGSAQRGILSGDANSVSVGSISDIPLNFNRNSQIKARIDGNDFQIPNDNGKIELGASQDLSIYHNGSNSYIKNSTNSLFINSAAHTYFGNADNSEYKAKFHNNGSVELYHDNVKRLETTSSGVTVTGTINFGSGMGSGLNSNGFNINFADSNGSQDMAKFGDSGDLKIYHQSNSSYIINSTGNLNIGSNNEVRIKGGSDVAEHMGRFIDNGAVELYYDGVKTFATENGGIAVTDDDTTSYVKMVTSGGDAGYLHGLNNSEMSLLDREGHYFIRGTKDGATDLYHDNIIKLSTSSSGATITDSVKVNGASNGGQTVVISSGSNRGSTIGVTNTNAAGIFWSTGNGYGIYKTPGAWSGNYQQLTLEWITGIHLNGGTSYGLSGVRFTGHALPTANNTYDLGNSSLRWRNVYTNDLNLSNEGGANDVDNTWGDYTIQEGESDLFLINNRSGKKYKFNLTEVS